MPDPFVKTDCMEEFMQIHPRFRKKYEELQRKEEEKSKTRTSNPRLVSRGLLFPLKLKFYCRNLFFSIERSCIELNSLYL